MKLAQNSARLAVKNGWITCPYCSRNERIMKVRPDTEGRCLQVFCRSCKREIILDIDKGERVKLHGQ